MLEYKTVGTFIAELSAPPPANTAHVSPIPNSETTGRSPIYRHFRFRDQELLTTLEPNVQSTHDLFEKAVQAYGNLNCLGSRKWNASTQSFEKHYTWIDYKEASQRSKSLGTGIAELANRVGVTRDKLGSRVAKPLRCVVYDTLGPDTTEYIINTSELPIVACSIDHIPELLRLAPKIPSLKVIICFDPLHHGEPTSQTKSAVLNKIAAQHGIVIHDLDKVESIGQNSSRLMRPPVWDDVRVISYTSGTTGPPKGVVLTQGNCVSAINGARVRGNVLPKDVHLSYLPLAHTYGLLIDQAALVSGADVGVFHGDVLGLVEDLKILKPTGFFSVPRLYNRFYSTIKSATVDASGLHGTLSRHVIATKKSSMAAPMGAAYNQHFLYDRIWTRKIKAAVGLDRARMMISGSAQLDPRVQQFLSAALANQFCQGYGMTEAYAMGSVQLSGDFRTGIVGPPTPNIEICLESVPEYNYSVQDTPNPRGEILLRGPTIFQGYYKNEEETRKCIDAQGWFHSGDIGEVDKLGCFKIIDRKKNVLKLAQGEYISPERLENAYLASCAFLASAYVHGDPSQASLVAIFGVDPEPFGIYAAKVLELERPIAVHEIDKLKAACAEPKVKKSLLSLLEKIGVEQKFNSYERVRNLHLAVEPFTVEGGLLAPTFKLKRPIIAKAFRSEIDRMYAEVAAVQPAAKMKL